MADPMFTPVTPNHQLASAQTLSPGPEPSDLVPGGAYVPPLQSVGAPIGVAPLVPPSQAAQALARGSRIGPRLALIATDIVGIALSMLAALALVRKPGALDTPTAIRADIVVTVPLFVIVLCSFAANGLYSKAPGQVLRNSFTELRDIVYALGVAGVVILGVDHISGHYELETSVVSATIVVALLLAGGVLPITRALVRWLLRKVATQQFRVLIVGTGMMARHLARYLSWDPRITVVGCVDDDPIPGTAVLGSISDLVPLCEKHQVDQVMVSFSRTHPAEAIRRLQALNDRVSVSIVPRYFELLTWRSQVREIAGLALIDVAPARLNFGSRLAKRSFDLAVGGVALLIGLPLIMVAAAAVKLSSRGPVLFHQERIGRKGKPFKMLKLRTMIDGAEAEREELEAENEMEGPLFKIRADPRVTPIGRFLRKSSIDELPQLWNVLRGDMALVGPRPFIASESSTIDGSAIRRFEVRPGITGLWQVSGRSHLTFDELQRLDYLYVASWSFWWDLRILWNTPAQVLKGHGAF